MHKTLIDDAALAKHVTAITNAIAIVELRLSGDEWSRNQGARMVPDISTETLVKMILLEGAALLADLPADTGGDDRTPIEATCTGVSASWCPIHGDCSCPEPELPGESKHLDDPGCLLHAPTSDHGETAQ